MLLTRIKNKRRHFELKELILITAKLYVNFKVYQQQAHLVNKICRPYVSYLAYINYYYYSSIMASFPEQSG